MLHVHAYLEQQALLRVGEANFSWRDAEEFSIEELRPLPLVEAKRFPA